MGTIIELIVIAAIAGGAMLFINKAWTGFKTSIAAPYVQAQIKADQPKIDAAESAQKGAEQRATNAQSDTAACVTKAQTQSDLVDLWHNRAQANAVAAQAARAQAQREATAAAPRIADLQAKAAAAPKLQSCEDALAKADKALDDSLRARRGLAPKAAPAGAAK